MRQDIDLRTIWNEAAKSGLVLGIFTAVFMFTGILTAGLASGGFGARLAGSLISVALWLVKFVGCLWLLRFFMLKFAVNHPELTPKSSFRFGMFTALTSAIIVAGVNLINLTVISPDSMSQMIDTYMQAYSSTMALGDSDRVALERTMSKLPQISFFVTLVYCFLYGVIASKIFSMSIPPRDIFGDTVDEQEDLK